MLWKYQHTNEKEQKFQTLEKVVLCPESIKIAWLLIYDFEMISLLFFELFWLPNADNPGEIKVVKWTCE